MTDTPKKLPDVTPVLEPLLNVLRSRKFIVALCGLIADLIVIAVPTTALYRDQLVGIITVFALGWMGMTTAEDVSKQHNDAKVEVAAHQASATIAAAQVMANKLPPDASADADTQPFPPVNGSLPHR